MKKIAVLGFGTVGSGTARMLAERKDLLSRYTGEETALSYILDVRDFPDSPFKDILVKDFSLIENDPEVTVVAEVIGGVKAAYEFTKRALQKGKSVVTSNKELVAEKGAELLSLARENGCDYLFEAAVGGGIPVISPLVNDLSHNAVSAVTGILNGTTNYILTRMFASGASFAEALAEAKAKGYAEADPSADVEGTDACRKIAILTALAFGYAGPPAKIYTEGITGIQASDVEAAEKAGYAIKLLGKAEKTRQGDLFVLVAPFFVDKTNPLSHVSDVYNGITVNGAFVGDVTFYGRGAGADPTASAVVADIRKVLTGQAYRAAFTVNEDALTDFSLFTCRRFIRVSGNPAAVGVVFGAVSPVPGEENAFLTPALSEKDYLYGKERLGSAGVTVVSHIRVL
ncbi:MAG: homoserine dehydrogenase [Clostridia bacterium]|nr:homoserine dehydrogenase [Clostridia bacterium]